MMWYMDIVWLVWIPVVNNTSFRVIYHKVGFIWSIILFHSGDSSTYDVNFNPPNCDVLEIWSWTMLYKVLNITMQHILSFLESKKEQLFLVNLINH